VLVDGSVLSDEAALRAWVQQGVTYTKANPTKNSQRAKKKAAGK
jgi:hypothetical protein